ncbi:MAG: hypothetical protein HEQ38_20320 [Gemmatimonas sp.]|nr:hypothetical protein [Gemmatimonas sp.]
MGRKKPLKDDDEFIWICPAFITLRNGRRIYASAYGKRCFPIRVRRKRD